MKENPALLVFLGGIQTVEFSKFWETMTRCNVTVLSNENHIRKDRRHVLTPTATPINMSYAIDLSVALQMIIEPSLYQIRLAHH